MSSSPYQPAATLLNKLWDNNKHSKRRVSLKSLVFDRQSQLTCSKTTYAQVCQVQRYQTTLETVWRRVTTTTAASSLPAEIKNEGLLYVLMYELLLGPHQRIRGGGSLKRSLLQNEDALRSTLEQVRRDEQAAGNTNTNNNAKDDDDSNNEAELHFPRYVRVNTLQTSTRQVVEHIQQLLQKQQLLQEEEEEEHAPARKRQNTTHGPLMYADPHVPDLLVLPTGSTPYLQQDAWLHSKIVLQDKSSCFSALCLVRGYNDGDLLNHQKKQPQVVDWIDACSAPGNKTSHLAALVQQCVDKDSGSRNSKTTATNRCSTVYAFDRDPQRHQALERRMQQLVPAAAARTQPNTATTAVQMKTACQDFLTTQPADYPHVYGILLDPTCSGSGMFGQDHNKGNNDDKHKQQEQKKRIQQLSKFQTLALEHAMSFPSVQRIVYSTCSIHAAENEHVVARALQNHQHRSDSWELVAPRCLAHWKQRGICDPPSNNSNSTSILEDDDKKQDDESPSSSRLSKEETACLIRVMHPRDETNGFFVACLQRRRRTTANANGDDDAAADDDSDASTLAKKKRSVKKQSAAKKDLQKQARRVGLELYHGQFAQTTKKDNADTKSSSSEAATAAKTTTTNSPTKEQKQKERSTTSGSSGAKKGDESSDKKKNGMAVVTQQQQDAMTTMEDSKLSKKRAKKREWKKRQRQQKLERLQQKKQKTK